ncbi:hypothetical protein BDR26DRAFT_689082 [Obelidium mucronatum]|nr:hypothetical protein BDR26DRAFT_689082 [Obelidium mucronatum]
MLTLLPPELLFLLAFEHLDHRSVVALSHTCSSIRSLLVQSQSLWSKLVFQKTGISYIHEGGDWREAYFDSEFCSLCPHLSTISNMDVMNERAQMFFRLIEGPPELVSCSGTDCGIKMPNLWLCCTPKCNTIGCSRATNQHGLRHFEESSHSISMKIDTVEFWCYTCMKWLASPTSLPAERQLIQTLLSTFLAPNREPYLSLRKEMSWNDQRNIERETLLLKSTDVDLYLVEIEFMNAWRAFMSTRVAPPSRIDNSKLLMEDASVIEMERGGGLEEDDDDEDSMKGVVLSNTSEKAVRLVRPNLLPFRDFMIVNKVCVNGFGI